MAFNRFLQPQPQPLHLFETFEKVGDAIDTIASIFTDTGKWCAECINAGLKIFSQLISGGISILTKKVEDASFADFYEVAKTLSGIILRIAGPLIVVFFLYRLFDEVTDIRNQMDIWGLTKCIIKMNLAGVLVANAVTIVSAIFNVGALIAKLLYVSVTGNSIDFSQTLALSDTYVTALRTGVSGLKGFLILFLYLIGMIAIIVCGLIVVVEIYKRVMRLFMILPFGSFSFATYTLSDFKGHEIFQGYLKGVIKTSIEAIVIMLAICFSYILLQSGHTTEALFPSKEDGRALTTDITIRNDDEYELAYFLLYNPNYEFITEEVDMNNVSDAFLADFEVNRDLSYILSENTDGSYSFGVSLGGESKHKEISGVEVSSSKQFGKYERSITYPATLTIYEEVDWYYALIILLRELFPCLLCSLTVKESDRITGIIVGGFC